MDLLSRVRRIEAGLRNLGVRNAITYRLKREQSKLLRRKTPYTLSSVRAVHPLYVRPGTSDVDVFSQIFVGREYRCLDGVHDAELVIDCGANVGYASAYFLSAYPKARVIAVEPDDGNFAALERNLAPYGSRVTTIHSGIWSHSVGLKMSEEKFGDGREWARTVRPVVEGEVPMMMATDIGTIFRESGAPRISILKVDIEGAEKVAFAENYASWLDAVDNLVIELHGPDCDAVFFAAIAGQGFDVSTCDELTVCRRLRA